MRSLLSLLIVLIVALLAGCSGGGGSAGCQPVSDGLDGTGGAGVTTGIPGVLDLDRLASEATEPAYGVVSSDTVFAQSPSVNQNGNDDWVVPYETGTSRPGWIIRRSKGPLASGENIRYTTIYAGDEGAVWGEIWCGVADYASGTWNFFDCSGPGWVPDWPERVEIGMLIPEDVQPVSPGGYIYIVAVAATPGSQGVVRDMPQIEYEFDGGFLEPPVITDVTAGPSLHIDPGPDINQFQCQGLQIFRCEGDTFDPETAVRVEYFKPIAVPAIWEDLDDVSGQTYTYALALDGTMYQSSIPGSPYSNTVTAEGL